MDNERYHFSLYVTIPSSLDDCQKLHDPTRLRTRLFTPQGLFSQVVLGLFTCRFTSAKNFNFTHGLCLHKDYMAGREFVARKGGCCSAWGPPAACASSSWGPVLPFDPGVGVWAPVPQRWMRGLEWETPEWLSERERSKDLYREGHFQCKEKRVATKSKHLSLCRHTPRRLPQPAHSHEGLPEPGGRRLCYQLPVPAEPATPESGGPHCVL